MKLYHFDGIDERLDLVPLAARRALDRAGLKLSLDGWRSLPLEQRRAIVEAGSNRVVDVAPVVDAVKSAEPGPTPLDLAESLPHDRVPGEVAAAFGDVRPISDAVWASLGPLDQYALVKVAKRRDPIRLAAAYDEIIGQTATSTHLAPGGGARMVDVAEKPISARRAVAESTVVLGTQAYDRLKRADVPKGDVFGTARLAGIMAAKRTPEIVPLCHPISLTHVGVELALDESARAVRIRATVEALDRTGVEMEALHAASAAALTVYDMLKSFDRSMEIGPTRLIAKAGGRSGDFER